MIKEAIQDVVSARNLSEEQMREVMNEIMSGECSDAQIGGFLTGLRCKGETVDEIVGAVTVMRDKATRIDTGVDLDAGEVLVDTCGTGGDGSGSFNVSTASAFVVAGAGLPVAKHGNRAISSKCGSADVLEALGVDLGLPPEKVGRSVREIGIGFLFAPALHGAMKHAIGPRRELGIRTIFNILGPMTNPAGANVQVLGVFAPELTGVLAEVLARLGSKRALVVWGEGNLDELTVTGETRIAEVRDGRVESFTISPEDVGLSRADIRDLRGSNDPAEAAVQVRDVLSGVPGVKLDMVLLNSGAALMAAGQADTIADGISLARTVVSSGKATAKLEQLVAFSREQAEL